MRETVEHLGRHQLRQRDHLPKLGTDAKYLARFVTIRPRDRVWDLGCGVGVLGLLLAERRRDLTLNGVELMTESAELARQNLRENHLTGTILRADLRDYRTWHPRPGGCDLVISNPPYFPPGTGKTAAGERGAARSETTCTLEELCSAAGWLLQTGGRFALCHRPERLAELFLALHRAGLEPKRMQLVQHTLSHPPSVALVEAIRQGKPGLRVLPTLLIQSREERESHGGNPISGPNPHRQPG